MADSGDSLSCWWQIEAAGSRRVHRAWRIRILVRGSMLIVDDRRRRRPRPLRPAASDCGCSGFLLAGGQMVLHELRPYTMEYSSFAECQGHLAKAQRHSANSLPSVTLGIQHTSLFCRQTVVCRVFFIVHSANSLPSVNKHSAKRNSRHKNDNGMAR